MQDSSSVIKEFNSDNLDRFQDMLGKFGFYIDHDYYERCFDRHKNGDIVIVLAEQIGGEYIGYCILNWQPKYAYFKKCNIPEIQDLNVLSRYRRRGVGRALIEYCEGAARSKGHKEMGIAVGMDSSFGAAQRLYVKMGYVPDGAGLCYDRKPVAVGEFKPIDENLSLMMIKALI